MNLRISESSLPNLRNSIAICLLVSTIFSRCLKKLLTKSRIYDLQHYRPHSLRKGGITDLTVAGVEDSVIRRMARHSINSKSLFIYQCLSSFEVGFLAFT